MRQGIRALGVRFAALVSFIAVAIVTVGPAAAQDVAPVKVAVIEMQQIERQGLAWQDLRAKFQSENDKVLQELRQIQQSLEQEGQQLAQQQAILAPDAFDVKRQEFEARLQSMNQQAGLRKQALERALLEARVQIIEVIREIVVAIAEEQGLNLILDKSSADPTIVLSRPEIEITQTVLERLDARIQTVAFTVAPVQQ